MSEYFNPNYFQFDTHNMYNNDLTNELYMDFNNSSYIIEETHQGNLENVKTGMETFINEKKGENISFKGLKRKKLLFKSSENNLGRKRKSSVEKGKHTRYDGDNIIRKIKGLMIKYLINFSNQLIYSIYDGKIGYGPSIKKIFTINQRQIIESKHDKAFINKTLKEILSDKITGRISNYIPEHNRNIIEILLNEEDNSKREKLEKFFNLKFIDCIQHYSGKIRIPILIGIETLKKTCDDMKLKGEDEDYIKIFMHYVDNFKKIVQTKKNRNTKQVIDSNKK